ncbi:MAG: amidohydrolase family protein [Gammaproteobacteria bacterium]
MQRREFLEWLGLGGADTWLRRYWPRDGLWNACAPGPTPAALRDHPVLQACWEDIDPAQVWDAHAHLIGLGDNGGGAWVNPRMRRLRHPWQYTQFAFYLNAACAEQHSDRDGRFVERLLELLEAFPPGVRALLLAFDYRHDAGGVRDTALSAFYTPNAYAARIAREHPERLGWIASVHPYREDALAALDAAVAAGACAVKWLPAAMGMDPGSPACDAFYAALNRHALPLLVHCGSEYAVHGGAEQPLGNPLRLRRPLAQGVRVIVAHCASLGNGVDLDRGPDAPMLSNFALFARLMDEPAYASHLYGEISTVTQVNRQPAVLETLIGRADWQPRLINGSDYPLPGIVPLVSPGYFAGRGWLSDEQTQLLRVLRRHNPLLFDFLLKRMLRIGGRGFAPEVFMTRRHFERHRPPAGEPLVGVPGWWSMRKVR